MAFALVVGLGASVVPVSTAGAINVFDQCSKNGGSSVCKAKNDSFGSMIKNVVSMLLYLLGAVSALMIVIGGIRYATSNGDAGAVKSAKDTILYSIIGLVVAILSFTIVNFVISWF